MALLVINRAKSSIRMDRKIVLEAQNLTRKVNSPEGELTIVNEVSLQILQGETESQAQRSLARNDAVAAPEILVRSEEMHRAAFAFRATGLLAEHFRHAFVHAHAYGERVTVVSIGRDEMVVGAAERNGADGYRFLADVKMQKASHFAGAVIFQARLLETADANHLGV